MARADSATSISWATDATMRLPISSITPKASSTSRSNTSAQAMRALRVSDSSTETRRRLPRRATEPLTT